MTKEEVNELVELWRASALSMGEAAQLIDGLIEQNRILKAGISDVRELIDHSQGVYGLHLNGDPAPWTQIEIGGRYEEWLFRFNDAEELL